ncbi:MAG: hypothetical protein ACLSVD_14785 [Eggerthellaceae bacterium]
MLKGMGIRTVMLPATTSARPPSSARALTGHRRRAAGRRGREIRRLVEQGRVAMVGDGIIALALRAPPASPSSRHRRGHRERRHRADAKRPA